MTANHFHPNLKTCLEFIFEKCYVSTQNFLSIVLKIRAIRVIRGYIMLPQIARIKFLGFGFD